MFGKGQIEEIRARVQRVTGIELDMIVQVSMGNGLRVALENGRAMIAAEDANALARGYFLLSRVVREGKRALDVTQRRHIASCGVMLDCSRGAVLKVEAAKRYIDMLAALGMNLLMLYTEDTYEVPEYPHLGYLRGRYSRSDLEQLDAYAAEAGVELVPCIQTLGHMRQFLQWSINAPLRDQMDILLIDEEKTYELIEAQVRAMRACMRTKRIHIGMDEAHGVGLGQYLLRYGETDRHELLCRHLARVVKICEKYDFRPIMWSDMFFRLGSKKNDYYDLNAHVPQRIIDSIPPVDLCYWDYYHEDAAFYTKMLAEHARMGGNTAFAGGIWTWSGFLPHIKKTEATMFPALSACAEHGVDTVFATMWGDDGAETDIFLAAGMLPIFSEACWQGPGCDRDEIALAGECLTGMPREVLRAMGEFYPDETDNRTGKALIWGDLLYPVLAIRNDSIEAAAARAENAIAVLCRYEDSIESRYALRLFETLIAKAELIAGLREKYLAGDRAWLEIAAKEKMPALIARYDALMRAHRELWERDMKRFGWEVISLRYGAVTGRLEDVADEINRYLAGELEAIVELDEQPLDSTRAGQHFEHLVTPSADLGMGF